MVQIQGRIVDQAQFHVGFGFVARTGCNRTTDKAHMELTPAGLYIKNPEGEWVVPYSNVTWCKLVPESK